MDKKAPLHLACIEDDPEAAKCEHHGPMVEFPIVLKKVGHLWTPEPPKSFYFCPHCARALAEKAGVEPEPETRQELANFALLSMVKNHWGDVKGNLADLGEGRLEEEGGEMRILIDEPNEDVSDELMERLDDYGEWFSYEK